MLDDLGLLRQVRRTVHRWPEVGHEEQRTSALVAGLLTGLGLTVLRPAATSVATVAGPRGRPAIAVRAELDAIECTEMTGLPYASERPGLMHACGHDGHLAALVVLARRLVTRPPPAPALLIFQQAEETHPSGARLVTDGLGVDLWPADCVFGIHLWPEIPEGIIGLRTGVLLPGITGILFTLRASRGRSHGTHADLGGSNALSAMCRLCDVLTHLPSGRNVSDDHPVALHVGQAEAGEAPNRPAENGQVKATMRWISRDSRDRFLAELHQVAERIGVESGVDVSVSVDEGIRLLVANDRSTVARVDHACREAGLCVADYPPDPIGVSDDFGHYASSTPGALFLVGCGQGSDPADLHSSSFDFREEVLLPVVDALERLARHG